MISSIVNNAVRLHILAQSSAVNCPLGGGDACSTHLPTTSTDGALHTGLALFFAIMGVVSVVMVALGGFQFIMSQGDPQGTSKARMTIVYAVIGLAIAITAEAIIGFVLNKF